MTAPTMRAVTLPDGTAAPALGMGTWYLGEDPDGHDIQLDALRTGMDIGLTLIDTAEMYGDGAAEELVGRAIAGRRDDVFLVSKVLPHHATRQGTVDACQGSLRRLGTDRLDLYLLHWRGRVPVEETVAAFEALVSRGLIRSWGVSNFDVPDLEQLVGLPGGDRVQTDQVLYNLSRRGIEWDLLAWCQDRGLPIMAYSPIEQGRLLDNSSLRAVAARHDATPAQVALAWVLRHDGVVTVPKAGTPEHMRENYGALELQLTDEDLGELDVAFPPPTRPPPLETL